MVRVQFRSKQEALHEHTLRHREPHSGVAISASRQSLRQRHEIAASLRSSMKGTPPILMLRRAEWIGFQSIHEEWEES